MPSELLVGALPPSCPDFPEKRYRQATIVCEGPGACQASPLELAQACHPGPIIAVNRAIAFSDRIPFDVWARMDDPTLLWEWAQPHMADGLKFFSGNDCPNIWIWRELLGEDAGGRLYTRTPTYMEDLAEVAVDGAAPMMPTLFHVLAWLLQVGVTDVKLVGCDMNGSGSPLNLEVFKPDSDEGRLGWALEEDEGHQLRWQIERHMLALSIKQFRTRGARLKRWRP